MVHERQRGRDVEQFIEQYLYTTLFDEVVEKKKHIFDEVIISANIIKIVNAVLELNVICTLKRILC